MKKITTFKMVKSEDLNHHGTLFAGRCSEWVVESAFIGATVQLPPESIVCLKIHGLEFLHPSKIGAILCFESKIVHTGRTSLTVHTQVTNAKENDMLMLDGFITFCHVDEHGKSQTHGLSVEPKTEREIKLYEQAKALLKR